MIPNGPTAHTRCTICDNELHPATGWNVWSTFEVRCLDCEHELIRDECTAD